MNKKTQKTTVLMILVMVLLTACSPAKKSAEPDRMLLQAAAEEAPQNDSMIVDEGMNAVEEAAEISPQTEVLPADKGNDGFAASSPVEGQRLVIMNANLVLLVEDPAKMLDYVAEMAVGIGGYVVSSELGQANGQYGQLVPHASITIRVPSGRLGKGLQEIEEQAVEVISKNQTGQDVTKEYTDLQSRLRNLQRAEEQLNEVMEKAATTEDVLRVYNELVKVTEQIEILQGQIKYYEESATFSAITLELRYQEEAPPATPILGWQPGVTVARAFKDLKESMQRWTDGMIRFVIFTLPVLIVSLAPWVVAGWLFYRLVIRKWAQNRKKDTPEFKE